MALIDKKLTDLTEKLSVPDDAFIHIVDVSDTSQSPEGSSYKARKSTISGTVKAQIGVSGTVKTNSNSADPIVYLKSEVDSLILGKQDELGFTPENVANKQTNLDEDLSGLKYPNVTAVRNGLSDKASLADLFLKADKSSTYTKAEVDNIVSSLEFKDVIEADSFSLLPLVGESEKIYITLDTNLLYRFDGVNYIALSADVSGKEDIANKQNSLAVDATNLKYPTVTAVNAGLATKVSSTATNTFIPKVNSTGNLVNSNLLDDGSFIRASTDIVINGVRFGLGTGNRGGNIGIGSNNFASDIIGTGNVALGGFSLFSNRGFGNLGIGTESLLYTVDGSGNLGLGFQAGTLISDNSNNTRSDNSLFLGANTKPLGVNQTNQIVVGVGGIGLGSNTTVIGNPSTLFGRWYGDLLVGQNTRDGINAAIINGTVKASPAVTNDQLATLGQVNSSAVLLTGNQSGITGLKGFVSTDSVLGGITLSNSKTTGAGYGIQVFNTGVAGIYAENTGTGSTGNALQVSNISNTGNGILVGNFGTGIGVNLRNQAGTGDLLNAESGVTRILSTGRLQTTLPPTNSNDVVNLNAIKSRDGWASYSTTTYTNASPFTVAPNTTVTLPNNANNSITSDLPLGVTAFYNGTTNKITPVAVGDAYTVNVRFKARTTMNNDYLTLFIDIGTGTQINAEAKQFLKGANTEQPFSFTMPIFTLATFVANGGEIKVSSNSGTISIYDVTFYINRNYTR